MTIESMHASADRGNLVDEARAVRAVRTILAWRYAARGNAAALNTLQQLSAGRVGQ